MNSVGNKVWSIKNSDPFASPFQCKVWYILVSFSDWLSEELV